MKSQDGLDQVSDARGAAAEFAKEPPGLEAGHGLFAERPDLCVRAVNGLLTCGEFLPSSPVGHADSAAGALVRLVRPAGNVRVHQGLDDAVDAGRLDVVDRAGSAGETHINRPKGSVRTCTFIPCLLCLPE